MIKIITFKSVVEINTKIFLEKAIEIQFHLNNLSTNEDEFKVIVRIYSIALNAIQGTYNCNFEGVKKILYEFGKEKIIEEIKSNSSNYNKELWFKIDDYRKYVSKIKSIIDNTKLPKENNPEMVEIEYSNKIGF